MRTRLGQRQRVIVARSAAGGSGQLVGRGGQWRGGGANHAAEVGRPLVHQQPPAVETCRAGVCSFPLGLDGVCERGLDDLPRVIGRSAAQSRKLDRNPWGTRAWARASLRDTSAKPPRPRCPRTGVESLGMVGWWRRRESNPRPRIRPHGTLHACPRLLFRHPCESAAKTAGG